MKAVVCSEFGPIENLTIEERPDPQPGPGEVVIAIKAAGVNFPDGLMVRGDYQVKPPRPFTPGTEVAGIVSAVGADVGSFKPGDRVVSLCGMNGFAEKVAVDAERVLPIPDSMDFAAAGGMMLVYGTSLHALQNKAKLKPGETLLVLGAAGGVGLAAVELGVAMGARVIAAASSDEKCALAKAHGADSTINYGTADLKSELKRLIPGGVDVVYDPVGGPYAEAAIRGMGWGGRYLVVGFAHGEIPKLPLNLLLLNEREAIGVFWGAWTQRDPAGHAANITRLMQWFAEGKIRPHVGARYPLAQARDALNDVMQRRARGKVIITNT